MMHQALGLQSQITPEQTLLPKRVKDDAAFVMSMAQHITIATDKIKPYAQELVVTSPLVTCLDSENHFVLKDDPVKTASYVLALDSINFGSGVFATSAQVNVGLEYAPVAQSLKQAFIKNQWTTPEQWLEISGSDCHQIFCIPQDKHPLLNQLMDDFACHLRWTGRAILNDFGNVASMLQMYRGHGLALLEKVAAWPHFSDATQYLGREIAVFKRAQILLADLELALGHLDTPFFGGLENLTCFADNMVPHVLRQDGLLSYSETLAEIIDTGEPIAEGSVMETELRCAAIHTVELLRQSLGGGYTAVNLDHMLWHRGYQPGFSNFKPHRTMTTWY